jgi:creatinine amidohydrolase
VLATVVVELTRSMSTWADRVVFVNAHGGNTDALQSSVTRLVREGHSVSWFPCRTEVVDAHAGRTETSLLLHLCPDRVHLDRVEVGNTSAIGDLLPALVAQGVRSVSPNGVLGDPRDATAGEGARVLEEMVTWIRARLPQVPT